MICSPRAPGPGVYKVQGTQQNVLLPQGFSGTLEGSHFTLYYFLCYGQSFYVKGFEKLFDWWSNMGDIQNIFTSDLTTTRGINRILPLKRPHPVYIYCRQLEVCFIANYSTLYCRTGTTCLTNHSQRPTTSRLFFTLARGFCLDFFSPLWFCHYRKYLNDWIFNIMKWDLSDSQRSRIFSWY